MLIRKNLRRLITPWVILGSFLVGFSLMGAALLLFWLAMPDPVPAGIPTAAITVVAYPTTTPTLTLSTPTEIPTTTVTPTPLPTPVPGDIALGAYVEIKGTGRDGLRLRVEPGLSSNVLFLGQDSEVFRVGRRPGRSGWIYLVVSGCPL
jgi:hypothetical protein